MRGRRVPDETLPHLLLPGDYGYYQGVLYARCPNSLLVNFSKHDIEEYPDGTISATPSIKCDDGLQTWHGYLTKGEWKEV